jgi:DNA-binding transcriptional MerR regulator
MNDVQQMSNNEPAKYISLREVGRRLGIPPSTVVYYKDRFERFLPETGGRGRRKRYPAGVLEIFKAIRELYDKNWTAEQIEEHLEERFDGFEEPRPADEASGDGSRITPEMIRSMAGMLERMTGFMEGHETFRGDIEDLRTEVESLRREREVLEKTAEERIESLEREVAKLRKENSDMERYIVTKIRQSNPLHSKPSRLFMNLPLVIRSEQDEYLGVAGRSKEHFSLKNLVSLVQRNASATRRIDIEWDQDEEGWLLKVSADDKETDTIQRLLFAVREKITPSKNLVVELTRMVVDGNTVPRHMQLSLFKQIRDSFA